MPGRDICVYGTNYGCAAASLHKKHVYEYRKLRAWLRANVHFLALSGNYSGAEHGSRNMLHVRGCAPILEHVTALRSIELQRKTHLKAHRCASSLIGKLNVAVNPSENAESEPASGCIDSKVTINVCVAPIHLLKSASALATQQGITQNFKLLTYQLARKIN